VRITTITLYPNRPFDTPLRTSLLWAQSPVSEVRMCRQT